MKTERTAMARKQYLIPSGAVRKIEALSRSEKVSQGEIVRRAIEAYEPKPNGVTSDDEISALLEHTDELVRQTIGRLDETHRFMAEQLHAIESGENRRRAEAEMRAWAKEHPEMVAKFSELLFGASPSDGSTP